MKSEKIINIVFIIVGIIGFIEFSFVRGMFTGPITMIICGITGIFAVIYNAVKKEYKSAVLYALLFATLVSGYLKLM